MQLPKNDNGWSRWKIDTFKQSSPSSACPTNPRGVQYTSQKGRSMQSRPRRGRRSGTPWTRRTRRVYKHKGLAASRRVRRGSIQGKNSSESWNGFVLVCSWCHVKSFIKSTSWSWCWRRRPSSLPPYWRPAWRRRRWGRGGGRWRRWSAPWSRCSSPSSPFTQRVRSSGLFWKGGR